MARYEKLNEWERLAIEAAIERQIASGKIHSEHGATLLSKLQNADSIATKQAG